MHATIDKNREVRTNLHRNVLNTISYYIAGFLHSFFLV